MNDVVNLRQFRKRKTRDEREKTAEQNRISFGRNKLEKATSRHEALKAEQFLTQNKREHDE